MLHMLPVFYFIVVKTIVVKGRAPVDPECPAHSTMHVFTEGADIYDVMLNQVK